MYILIGNSWTTSTKERRLMNFYGQYPDKNMALSVAEVILGYKDDSNQYNLVLWKDEVGKEVVSAWDKNDNGEWVKR